MSFPWLMVKVRRHKSISVKYQDETGTTKLLENLDPATSELFQVTNYFINISFSFTKLIVDLARN